jgi:hypothetical protein
VKRTTVPEMLIPAPKHECADDFDPWQVAGPKGFRCATDTPFNEWVEDFLDEGVHFAFDAEHGRHVRVRKQGQRRSGVRRAGGAAGAHDASLEF